MANNLTKPPAGSLIVNSLDFDPNISDRHLYLSLIIPTFNESANLAKLIHILVKLLDEKIRDHYELIVVDDNSPDKTWKYAQELTEQYPQLRVMCRQQEKGLATAVIRGWQVARGEILGVIDADLQHPPKILLQLLTEIERGADLSVASRHLEGGGVSDWHLGRRILSRGAQIIGLAILPEVIGRLSDPMSGYFLVKRSAIAGKRLNPFGYKILIAVMARSSVKWLAEISYVFQERKAGTSKVTSKHYWQYLQHLIQLRFDLWQVKRFLRFGIVGFSGVFVDMILLYLLSDPSSLGWGLTRSKIMASEVAIINNFIWNDAWTFADFAKQQRGWNNRIRRFLKFNAVCLIGLALNVVILNFFFNLLFEDLVYGRYIANLIAIAVVTIWNFWFNLKLNWRVTSAKE